jgi:uncharacterized protein (TIGR02466 family)
MLDLNLEIETLFATPLVAAILPDADAVNAELRRTILDRAERVPGRALSNRGGWQSEEDFGDWSGGAGARVLSAALAIATRLTTPRAGHAARAAEWKISAWANVNRKGHGNESHIHAGAFWSGVYYVDGGGAADDDDDADDASIGGEIEFSDPLGAVPVMYAPHLAFVTPGADTIGNVKVYVPAAGLLLMFPSWVPHAVRPYVGDGARISVAWNLAV